MAKISLSPTFIKDSIILFIRKSPKEILLGKKVQFSDKEEQLARRLTESFASFRTKGARKGNFTRRDPVHSGKGTAYLIPNALGDQQNQSLLIFSQDTQITRGPDLYVYLSPKTDPKKGYGEYLNLGLLKGNKGGQSYVIDEPLEKLKKYRSVAIDCKQFEVLFTFAKLA